jgi:hypothetical protein
MCGEKGVELEKVTDASSIIHGFEIFDLADFPPENIEVSHSLRSFSLLILG